MSQLPKEMVDLSALSGQAPELADMLVSVASDIALVIDAAGVIERVALGVREPVKAIADEWVGRRWSDTVTRDTRQKVEQLLDEVARNGVSRVRQVNHPSPPGMDVAVAYSAVRLGQQGPVLAVGRNLSVVASMQQRLIQVQQEMERDYWQRRQSEARYQLMFQIGTDPMLVIDSVDFRVLDVNRAAIRLLGVPIEHLLAGKATAGFANEAWPRVEHLLRSVRDTGKAGEEDVPLADGRAKVQLAVSAFHSGASTVLLMRIRMRMLGAQGKPQSLSEKLLLLMWESSDAVVIADAQGRLSMANPSFLDLAQLSSERHAKGRSLSDWISTSDGILSRVKASGNVHSLTIELRGEHDRLVIVELSATLIGDHEDELFGIVIRTRQRDDAQSPSPLPGRPGWAVH